MRTQWLETTLTDMQDAADAEGYAGITALGTPSHELAVSLPYFGAFAEYHEHITSCRECLHNAIGCPEGEALLEVSRVGVTEQHRIAESN